MDFLSSFLKTALYRVVFVLIVGIPAIEIFSLVIFNNGIVLNIVNSANSTSINAELHLRLNRVSFRNPYHNKYLPGLIHVSPKAVKEADIYIENSGVRIYGDPILAIENPNLLKFKLNEEEFLISFRDFPATGWILYLLSAFIIGEMLCFLGELIIGGCLFKWNPFSSDEDLELVTPCGRNSQDSNNNQQDRLRVSDLSAVSSNVCIFEMSEIHYVVSRIFAGLGIIFAIACCKFYGIAVLFIFLLPLFIAFLLSCIFPDKNKAMAIMLVGFCVFIVILFCLLQQQMQFCTLSLLLCFLSFLISIVYRSHANRLIKLSTKQQDNGRSGGRTE